MKTQKDYMADRRLDEWRIEELASNIASEKYIPCGWWYRIRCDLSHPLCKSRISGTAGRTGPPLCAFDCSKMSGEERIVFARMWLAMKLMEEDVR